MLKPTSVNWLSQNVIVPATAFPKWHSLCQDHAEPAELLLVKASSNEPRPRELLRTYESMTCYLPKSLVGKLSLHWHQKMEV